MTRDEGREFRHEMVAGKQRSSLDLVSLMAHARRESPESQKEDGAVVRGGDGEEARKANNCRGTHRTGTQCNSLLDRNSTTQSHTGTRKETRTRTANAYGKRRSWKGTHH